MITFAFPYLFLLLCIYPKSISAVIYTDWTINVLCTLFIHLKCPPHPFCALWTSSKITATVKRKKNSVNAYIIVWFFKYLVTDQRYIAYTIYIHQPYKTHQKQSVLAQFYISLFVLFLFVLYIIIIEYRKQTGGHQLLMCRPLHEMTTWFICSCLFSSELYVENACI